MTLPQAAPQGGTPAPTEMLDKLRAQITTADDITADFTGFLLTGLARQGKTMQIWTLPRPCLVFVTDLNTDASLKGAGKGIHLVHFTEDGISLGLKGGKNSAAISGSPRPAAFEELYRFLTDGRKSGLLQEYKSIVLDSVTGLQNAVMDAVMWEANRPNGIPDTDEYVRVGSTIAPIIREMRSLPAIFTAMAHVDPQEDRGGVLKGYKLAMIGKLRQAIPANASDIYFCQAKFENSQRRYVFHTRPSGYMKVASTTVRDIPDEFDATILDFSKPEEYGLGRILKAISGERPFPAEKKK